MHIVEYAWRVPALSTSGLRFGDLLARARQAWVSQMARVLAEGGWDGYRRSDAAALRLLLAGPVSIGGLGAPLGVTRQAARKVADGLVQRGYATVARDGRDARQLNVTLTPRGLSYAHAVIAAIERLHEALAAALDPDQLAAAEGALRAVIGALAPERAAPVPPD